MIKHIVESSSATFNISIILKCGKSAILRQWCKLMIAVVRVMGTWNEINLAKNAKKCQNWIE
jgi:hypothetical protein